MTQAKPNYATDQKIPANCSPLALTLRQLRETVSGPILWLVVGAAALMTAMAGPYFTLERFTFPERLVYRGTNIPIAALIMTFLSTFAYRLTEARPELRIGGGECWIIGRRTGGGLRLSD
ncbi:MAG: hypothetical protein AAF631_13005 [Pseudomonadota bacterium]